MEDNVTTVSAEDGGVTAKVDKIISMDGDVDVNQRKGKVITIFDVKLVLEYSGASSLPCSRQRVSLMDFRPHKRQRGRKRYHHRS